MPEVAGELAELAAGRAARLRLTAKITVGRDQGAPALDVTGFPPGSGPSQAARAIASRCGQLSASSSTDLGDARLPFRDVSDLTSMRNGVLVRCCLAPGADPGRAAGQLREVWGVGVDLDAKLPQPLPGLLGDWVTRHGADESEAGVRRLRFC